MLGRAVIVSRLPYLPLPPFAFPPSPRHHDACLLCYEDRLISLVRYEGSPPQYRGYRVNPAASCGGILPRARICLGKGQGEGLLSNFSGKSSGKWSVNLLHLLIFANARGLRFFWGGATATERPGVLGGNDQKIERGIDRE